MAKPIFIISIPRRYNLSEEHKQELKDKITCQLGAEYNVLLFEESIETTKYQVL